MQGLDNRTCRVVYKQHNVRKLQRSIFSYSHSRGNSLYYRRFCSADKRISPASVVVALKVYSHKYSVSYSTVGLRALDIYHTVGKLGKYPSFILPHTGIYLWDPLFCLIKIYLGQYHIECRGGISDYFLRTLPIFRLTRELVAGYHRPSAGIIFLKVRQKDICRKIAFVHCILSYSQGIIFSNIG